MNKNNEERVKITFTRSQVVLNFDMHPESEFSNPDAIIRTCSISQTNGIVRVIYNTYYIYCERYPEQALQIFIDNFPCFAVWSWEKI